MGWETFLLWFCWMYFLGLWAGFLLLLSILVLCLVFSWFLRFPGCFKNLLDLPFFLYPYSSVLSLRNLGWSVSHEMHSPFPPLVKKQCSGVCDSLSESYKATSINSIWGKRHSLVASLMCHLNAYGSFLGYSSPPTLCFLYASSPTLTYAPYRLKWMISTRVPWFWAGFGWGQYNDQRWRRRKPRLLYLSPWHLPRQTESQAWCSWGSNTTFCWNPMAEKEKACAAASLEMLPILNHPVT